MIDKFLQFVTHYDPNFRDRIKGASREEIGTLEQLVGKPLPPCYVEFLEKMGHSDGDLDLAYDGSCDIDAVIDYYRDVARKQDIPPPPNCIVIATGDPVLGQVFLETSEDGPPRVMLGIDGHIDRPYRNSLENVLYSRAYLKYEFAARSFLAFYLDKQKRNLVPMGTEIALSQGLQPLWFSDSEALCAQNKEVVFVVERTYTTRGTVKIAADQREEVERLGSVVIADLGLEFWRWARRGS